MGERDEPLDEDGELEALEQGHLSAFSAFTRGPARADHDFAAEPSTSHLHPALNPRLARCVYAGERGRIYIVPGPGAVCFVSIAAGTGETVTEHTTIELASAGALGHHGWHLGDPGITCVGVLPLGGQNLRILDRTGGEIQVPLTSDDGYWITVGDPVEIVWTTARGESRHSLFHTRDPPRISGQG